ncbi:MAG: hypothetical protein PHF00_09820, partial [Elusimicrobia bacterium]|nr:hypothetical protein [Elusimicrobiota bacterium]
MNHILRRFFDGGPIPAQARLAQFAVYSRLQQLRALLSLGTPAPQGGTIGPFVFRLGERGSHTAPAAGLEGFVHGEARAAALSGRGALLHHLADYGRYLDDLLAPVPWADDARRKTRALLQSGDGAACYERLLAFVHVYLEELRGRIDAADLSRWVRR